MAEERWSVAVADSESNLDILKLQVHSDNCQSCPNFVGQPHCLDHQRRICRTWTKRYEQYLILVMVQQTVEFSFEYRQSHIVERALEYRVLQPSAKTL